MYSVMLVDDEPWAVYGLTKLIPWERYGFVITATFNDGMSALEAATRLQPNLIITDIRMPGLGGLELVQALKNVSPHTQIILVSGYSEFDYVQSGLRLGICDYLLKQVNEADLVNAIQKVRIILDKRGAELSQDLFFSLFSEDNQRSIACCLRPLIAVDPDWKGVMITRVQYKNEIFSLSPNDNILHTISFQTGKSKECVILCIGDNFTDADLSSFQHNAYVGVSEILSNNSAFFTAYRQSDIAATTAAMQKSIQPLHYTATPQEWMYSTTQTLSLSLRNHSIDGIIPAIQDIKQLAQTLLLDGVARLYNLLLLKMRDYDMDLGGLEPLEYHQIPYQHSSVGDLFDAVILALSQSRRSIPGKTIPIQRILDTIDANFSNNINLTDVAGRLHITPNYLSILIKKATGLTFTDLLIQKRIAIAKELLANSDLTIQEIVEKVGYQEYSYFNKLFKKHAGITPFQFRQSLTE